MDYEHSNNPEQMRATVEAIVARRRAQHFAGKSVPDDVVSGDASARTDYLLQSLHATLSAQRALWSTFEMLRQAVRIDVGHELSDSALGYIGQLAASGIVDLVTHEHVAELLAIKDPKAGGNEAQEAAQ